MRTKVVTSCLLLALTACAAWACQAPQALSASATPAVSFSYKFENTRFYIPLIEVDLAEDGTGEVRFKRGESDEVLDLKLRLLPATIARIRQLYDATQFLSSDEEYQAKKDFSHMGWTSLGARRGERTRNVRFNFTTNPDIRELSEIFLGLATQQIHLFDLENARRYQPLDVPKQLEGLENDLRLSRLAEPEQMLAALRDIASDDTQTLIARNQASRIIESIKKGKFKSPMRK